VLFIWPLAWGGGFRGVGGEGRGGKRKREEQGQTTPLLISNPPFAQMPKHKFASIPCLHGFVAGRPNGRKGKKKKRRREKEILRSGVGARL